MSNNTQSNDEVDSHDLSLMYLLLSVAGLSAFSSGSVVLATLKIPQLKAKKLSHSLIFWMMLCDVVCNLQYAIPVSAEDGFDSQSDPGIMCIGQGMISQAAYLAVFFWNGLIAWTLFSSVILQIKLTMDRMKIYHAIVWLTCAVFTLIPIGSYGYAGSWCWISTNENSAFMDGHALRILCFYGIIWTILFAELVIFVLIVLKIRHADVNASVRSKLLRAVGRSGGYPIAMFVCWTIPTINRLYHMIVSKDGTSPYALSALHTISMGLQGVVFSAIFYSKKGVREAIIREYHARRRITSLESSRAGKSQSDAQERFRERKPTSIWTGPPEDSVDGEPRTPIDSMAL